MYASDHFPIILESAESEPRSRIPRRRLDMADWHFFTKLTSSDRSLANFHSYKEATTHFTNILHSGVFRSVRKISGGFPKHPVPWWNEDCSAAVRTKLTS